jgi:hypothetical protein
LEASDPDGAEEAVEEEDSQGEEMEESEEDEGEEAIHANAEVAQYETVQSTSPDPVPKKKPRPGH